MNTYRLYIEVEAESEDEAYAKADARVLEAIREDSTVGNILQNETEEPSAPDKDDEKHIEILQHDIYYWYKDGYKSDMDESDQEHIKKMIEEGYREGELCTTDKDNPDKTHYGWWSIKK
jgi:hypothetical protein